LSDEINLFNVNGLIAELTPLQIAIQYRHFDLVRFIMEKMNIDRRMSLALLTREPEDDSKTAKTVIEEPVKDGN